MSDQTVEEVAPTLAADHVTAKVGSNPLYHAHGQCANPECRSLETQMGFDEMTCLRCGRLTSLIDGHLVSLEEQFSPCNK